MHTTFAYGGSGRHLSRIVTAFGLLAGCLVTAALVGVPAPTEAPVPAVKAPPAPLAIRPMSAPLTGLRAARRQSAAIDLPPPEEAFMAEAEIRKIEGQLDESGQELAALEPSPAADARPQPVEETAAAIPPAPPEKPALATAASAPQAIAAVVEPIEAAPGAAPLPPRRPADLPVDAKRIAAPHPVTPAPVQQAARSAEPAPAVAPTPVQQAAGAPEQLAAPTVAPAPARQRYAGRRNRRAVASAAPVQEPGFFEKLFGVGSAAQRPNGPMLAYAPSDTNVVNDARRSMSMVTPQAVSPQVDRYTAIYDISARTVILPSGQRLEAHSGLGGMLDDPRYVHVRMHGATPPHLYQLSMREALFHGVEALRLTPIGGGSIYGRAGLLAHTYMLGPNGDSNGCVSFRDYQAFLQAYKSGEVRKLMVVSSR